MGESSRQGHRKDSIRHRRVTLMAVGCKVRCVDESLARSIGHRKREVTVEVAAAGDHVHLGIKAVEAVESAVAAVSAVDARRVVDPVRREGVRGEDAHRHAVLTDLVDRCVLAVLRVGRVVVSTANEGAGLVVDGHVSVRVVGGAGALVVHVVAIRVLAGEGEVAHPTHTGSARVSGQVIQLSLGRTRGGARMSAKVDVPTVIRRRVGVHAHETVVSTQAHWRICGCARRVSKADQRRASTWSKPAHVPDGRAHLSNSGGGKGAVEPPPHLQHMALAVKSSSSVAAGVRHIA
eukprot:scaffold50806_cov61-Phaeocystis_antarctica.AAC.5